MLGAMYKNHPVKIDIAGTVESIAQMNDISFIQLLQHVYNLSNMFICIAGNEHRKGFGADKRRLKALGAC